MFQCNNCGRDSVNKYYCSMACAIAHKDDRWAEHNKINHYKNKKTIKTENKNVNH